jgi:hypothetical protein
MSIEMDENGLGFVPLQQQKPHTPEGRMSGFVQIKPIPRQARYAV